MGRMIRDWALALGVGFLVFWLADVLSRHHDAHGGGEASAFNLTTIDGGTLSLADLKGSVAVLNFFATWCGPCKQEMPEFSAYAKAHPAIKLYGIVVPSNEGARLAEIVHRLPIAYPVLICDDPTQEAYRIDVFPTTYVLKADGTISDIIQGAIDRDSLAQAVTQAGG